MTSRKELKRQYKEMKPDMGVFKIESRKSAKRYIYAARDVKSQINRFRFQLNMGSHPNQELQSEWSKLGAENFTFEVLEHLNYDKDESKTNYDDELEILQLIWEEKLQCPSASPDYCKPD